ncbi:hypothetical protein GB937_006103 [Aspergillus fischeri]|nr:hypothetical protein GB937_006103 [Aspergillus fischeri]
MLSALYAAKGKLSIYYRETDKVYGDLFVIRIILTLFETYIGLYKECLLAIQGSLQVSLLGIQISKINVLFAPNFNLLVSSDETTQYLKSETALITL